MQTDHLRIVGLGNVHSGRLVDRDRHVEQSYAAEILDPALLRAGRFDRQILVDRPDRVGRIAILRVHLKKARIASDVDVEQSARSATPSSDPPRIGS